MRRAGRGDELQRRRGAERLPLGGILLAAAAWLGLRWSQPGAEVPLELALALTLLGVGGFLGEVVSLPRPLRIGPAVPGACLLALTPGVPGAPWVRVLVAATAAIGGVLVADFDRRHREYGLAVPLLAVSAVGVYFTVPDTEQAIPLATAAVAVAALAWPAPLVSLGTAGALASVGMLAWVAAVGGSGRHAAIVGGVACLSLLVAEPVSRLAERGDDRVRSLASAPWGPPLVLMVHAVLAAFASRVVGLRRSVAQAAVLAGLELLLAAVAALALGRLPRRAGPPATRSLDAEK